MITFRIVDTSEVGRAHAWHAGFAAANDAIFPRTAKRFADLALDRCIWCAMSAEDEILGMSYANVSEDEREVEIGGLMVAAQTRGKGIGDILMRLPLAHFLVTEAPFSWPDPPSIVAHALKGNALPRKIISRAGFDHHRSVKIPGDALPGLRTEADGHVHGDEFHLRLPGALITLADWLGTWNGTLRDDSPAEIDVVGTGPLTDWAIAIRSMI